MDKNMIDINMFKADCNNTCCNNGGAVFCFGYRNYSQTVKNDPYPYPDWEVALRWGVSVPLLIMGVVGNVCIIFILLRHNLLLRNAVNNFILNLSIADLILALIGPVLCTIRDTSQFWPFSEYWCYLEGYIRMTVMLVSVTSLAIISFDRMIGVIFPFHQHLKRWQTHVVLLIVWIYSLGMAVPFGINRVYLERQWLDVLEKQCNENYNYMKIWWNIAIMLLTWLPLLIMVICYVIIFIYIKKYALKPHGIDDKSRSKYRVPSLLAPDQSAVMKIRRKVILMMFVVVIVFIICWFPFQFFMIIRALVVDDDGNFINEDVKQMYNISLSIGQYMIYMTSVLDPIVYAFMHENFKKAFKLSVSRCRRKKPKFMLVKGDGFRGFKWNLTSYRDDSNDLAKPRTRTVSHDIRKQEYTKRRSVSLPQGELRASNISNIYEGLSKDASMKSTKTSRDTCYVADLSPNDRRKLSSSQVLGELIKEVIKEESSAEISSERYL